MDFSFCKRDIIQTSSDYASMITFAKGLIINLEQEAQRHANQFIEKISDARLGTHEALEQHMELWINDLKTQLKEFEFYGRATTLRTFFHLSNYLHTIRTPLIKSAERRCKIPVYDITFPKNNEDSLKLSSTLHKMQKRVKKKCGGRKNAISICE